VPASISKLRRAYSRDKDAKNTTKAEVKHLLGVSCWGFQVISFEHK
jgi:hypothetical protein